VRFVLFGRPAYEAYAKVLKELTAGAGRAR
jgi:hypothetical protein